jgi:hypothetical protein
MISESHVYGLSRTRYACTRCVGFHQDSRRFTNAVARSTSRSMHRGHCKRDVHQRHHDANHHDHKFNGR